MQHPLDFMNSLKKIEGAPLLNILREYLQVMTLKILYRMKESEHLRFGGGTCLRICHHLPRYSEDLDFSLDKAQSPITKWIKELQKGFKEHNVKVDLSIPKSVDQKRVAKYWLKFPDLLHPLGQSPYAGEKLAIKLEIDKHPPKKGNGDFFYITKFNEYFPIYKSDLPTLFSGKIGAICQRPYPAMRDFYDLLWYLNKGVEPNYPELQEMGLAVKDRKGLLDLLVRKTQSVDGKELLRTLGSFLEYPEEKKIFKNYALALKQASERFLGRL